MLPSDPRRAARRDPGVLDAFIVLEYKYNGDAEALLNALEAASGVAADTTERSAIRQRLRSAPPNRAALYKINPDILGFDEPPTSNEFLEEAAGRGFICPHPSTGLELRLAWQGAEPLCVPLSQKGPEPMRRAFYLEGQPGNGETKTALTIILGRMPLVCGLTDPVLLART